MGKAKKRRIEARVNYLAELLAKNPQQFLVEWHARLESWEDEAQRRANRLVDRNGVSTPGAHSILTEVREELAVIEKRAEKIARTDTGTTMKLVCSNAVAATVDNRLNRLTFRYPKT